MYLGVDYYPEHWDKDMMDEDMQRIVEMGSNIIRIGEFAWHLMEKKEGEYDFSFFDQVIEKAREYGQKIIFGTPTATFPAWLAKKHPSILSKDEYGHIRVFGGRRQYCYNSPVYRDYSAKLVRELVSHYSKEETIAAWQIDNEFGHEGSDMCYCEQCHEAFREFLKSKYRDIEALNETYGTIFWGQTYNGFDEIPMPQPTITVHNPSLQLDWARFRSQSLSGFAKLQIGLVRSLKGEHQQITHNFPGGFFEKFYDYNAVAEQLDFVAYDNYPVWGGLKEPISPAHIAMAHDFMRGLKRRNYWIVEELMGAQGHNVIGYLPRPGQAKMWAYQAMAHGCENLLFFRYRGMDRGAEQFCLGIIDQDNEKGRKFEEAQAFMKDVPSYETVVKSEIKSSIAVLYSMDNIWSWHYQQQSMEFDFTRELMRLYAPFYSLNANIDVISTDKDFSGYKVLVVPVLQIIDEALAKRFEEFARDGGTIMFSFRAGIKNSSSNLNFRQVFPCCIRSLTGISIRESESLQTGQEVGIIGCGSREGTEGSCGVWRDLITADTAETLYRYSDAFYGNKACITCNRFGMGRVYYVGGGVDDGVLKEIAVTIVKASGVNYRHSPEGLEVYSRSVGTQEWLCISNHSSEEQVFEGNAVKAYESIFMKRKQ